MNDVVLAKLKALPGDMRAHFRWIASLIQDHGPERVREPYVKHLDGALWEMRLSGRSGISRAIYITALGKRVVVLRAFVKKTQKTPRSELRLAMKRAEEVK